MIVINPAPLDSSYVPEKIFFRDMEIGKIKTGVTIPLKKGISSNMIIHGDSGTGKTSTVKYMMQQDKSLIYENALSFQNVKQLLQHIISRLGRPAIYRGMSYPDIFSIINSIIEMRGSMVIVLDEATNILKNDKTGIYNLFRASEIYKCHISTVLISMENPYFYIEKKYGTVLDLKFNNYSGKEIFHIIKNRAELALNPESFTDDILIFISTISEQYGSARFAIEMLQKSAYMAEYRLSETIESDDVRSAVSLINPYITESKLSLLDEKSLIVLLSICNLLKNSLFTTVPEIKSETGINCETYNIDIKIREIYSIIRKLESMDIISSKITGKGNKSGVMKIISINDVPVSILSVKIRDMVGRMGQNKINRFE